MMLDIYDFYTKMEHSNTMFSFKGDITSQSLTSILEIMELQLETMQEEPKIKKKVYNVLIECLQNLYHHMDEVAPTPEQNNKIPSAIFMIGENNGEYTIRTGNYIRNENIPVLKKRLEDIKLLSKEQLKEYYKAVLNNGQMSAKGGGGLGMIDIAIKSGGKFNFDFSLIDDKYSFFSLKINISK